MKICATATAAMAVLACAAGIVSAKDAPPSLRDIPPPSLRERLRDIQDAQDAIIIDGAGSVEGAWNVVTDLTDGLPGMTPDMLTAAYRQAAPDGVSLTHAAFATFLETMPTEMLPGDAADHPHQLENAARLADADADGTVSAAEFVARLLAVRLAASVSAHQLTASVASFPLDRAAFVELEHELLLGANLSVTEDALFEMMDTDGDDAVSRAEFLLGTFTELFPTLMVEATSAQIDGMLGGTSEPPRTPAAARNRGHGSIHKRNHPVQPFLLLLSPAQSSGKCFDPQRVDIGVLVGDERIRRIQISSRCWHVIVHFILFYCVEPEVVPRLGDLLIGGELVQPRCLGVVLWDHGAILVH